MKTFLFLLAFSFPILLLAQLAPNSDPFPDTGKSENGRGNAGADVQAQPVNLEQVKRLIGYPPTALQKQLQGKVIVRIVVDENGDYVKHTVLKNPGQPLTDGVEKQLPKLKFTPAVRAGKPVRLGVTIPFSFKLMMTPEEEAWNRKVKTFDKVYYSLEAALAAPNKSEVKVIMLNAENLTTFPSELLQFPNLTSLNLADNNIETIPLEIGNLKSLRFLNLSLNDFEEFPDVLWQLPNLESVYIGWNDNIPAREKKKLSEQYRDKLFPHDEKGNVKWD